MTEVATTARATTPTSLLTMSRKDGLLDPSLTTLLAGVTSTMRSTPCYVGHLTGVLGPSSIAVWSTSIAEGEKHLPFFSYTTKHKSAFFIFAEALSLELKQLSVLYDMMMILRMSK
jgi:hypothetical protein